MRSAFHFTHSAYVLWQEEAGEYRPISVSKLKIYCFFAVCLVSLLTSILLGGYLYFKEDVLAALVQAQQTQALHYEDRIAKMRMQMDRVSSRQLIDQELFEKKIDHLLDKQALMEERQVRMAAIGGGSARAQEEQAPRSFKPTPLSSRADGGIFASLFAKKNTQSASLGGKIERIEDSLTQIDRAQMAFVQQNQVDFSRKTQELVRLMSEFGIASAVPSHLLAQGGPYVPAPSSPKTTAFDKLFDSMILEKEKHKFFIRQLSSLPLARPLPLSHEITSLFGTRIDPFRGSSALHTGLDFRGSLGDSVKATAAGKVLSASTQGGYGLMVEIAHAHGFTTRYAHLSAVDVSEGQLVQAGQVIGKLGSTGRSTGPHLHYEVRREDEAQDPLRYVQASARVAHLTQK